MPATKKITLTQREAIYLSDALSMHMVGPPGYDDWHPYPSLLRRIGAAVLATQPRAAQPPPTNAEVAVDEIDLWVIRETAKSSVLVGNEQVGMNLLRKVYTLLLEEDDDETILKQAREVVQRYQPDADSDSDDSADAGPKATA